MSKLDADLVSEFGEIIKSKDSLIAAQERDMEALKWEIKHLKRKLSRSENSKK